MMNRNMVNHMLAALDVDLESYQRDHKCGVISDADMQIVEQRYTECMEFLLDQTPEGTGK